MISPSGPRGSRKEVHYRDHGSERQFLVNMHSTDGIDEFVEQRTRKSATSPATLEAAWVELRGEAALLEAMAAAEQTSQQNGEQIADSVIAFFRPLGQPAPHAFDCAIEVLPRIAETLQLDCRPLDVAPPCRALALSGAFAELLLRGQHGLHLLVGEGDELSALQCTILPCADSQSCEQVVAKATAAQQRWLESLEGEPASLDARGTEPFPLGRVVRVIHGPVTMYDHETMDDLRTGITLPSGCPADQLRRMLVAGIPCDGLAPTPTIE